MCRYIHGCRSGQFVRERSRPTQQLSRPHKQTQTPKKPAPMQHMRPLRRCRTHNRTPAMSCSLAACPDAPLHTCMHRALQSQGAQPGAPQASHLLSNPPTTITPATGSCQQHPIHASTRTLPTYQGGRCTPQDEHSTLPQTTCLLAYLHTLHAALHHCLPSAQHCLQHASSPAWFAGTDPEVLLVWYKKHRAP